LILLSSSCFYTYAPHSFLPFFHGSVVELVRTGPDEFTTECIEAAAEFIRVLTRGFSQKAAKKIKKKEENKER